MNLANLTEYCEAAIRNGQSLLEEAKVLIETGFFARGYFLGVAAIEEAGKCYLAHLGKGRELSNPAVQNRLKKSFEDHAQKIQLAIALPMEDLLRKGGDIAPFLRLMEILTAAREPSMYVDFEQATGKVVSPATLVTKESAINCLLVASSVLSAAGVRLQAADRPQFTAAANSLYLMKTDDVAEILKSEKFVNSVLKMLQESPGEPPDFAKAIAESRKDT